MVKEELCFGIIPLKVVDQKVQVLLALHVKGNYWGFPKGHGDPKESPQVAAQRELFEETDLKVHSFISIDYPKEDYLFERNGEQVHKYVTYFPAQVMGEITLKEPHEVKDAKWFEIEHALNTITFEPSKKLLRKLVDDHPDLAMKIS